VKIDHLIERVSRYGLTPLLTPPSAQHAETTRNREQRNPLRYAYSATLGNL
jgi:hypothetical protein